jgi:hypothetical protein
MTQRLKKIICGLTGAAATIQEEEENKQEADHHHQGIAHASPL